MIPARLQVLILGLEPMRRLEVWVFRVSLASHSFPSFPSFTPSGSCEAFATNEPQAGSGSFEAFVTNECV